MIYFSEKEILIRNMNNSDVTCIVNAEGEQSSPEKYLCRLKDQENFKCIALVVLYNKEVAGYVCIYPYSTNGILGKEGFSEIADFGILEKYKDLGIEKKLLDIAEQIASEYSNIVYTSVKLRKGRTLNMFFLRGYVLEESGIYYKNKLCTDYSVCEKGDDLDLCLFKILELTNIYKFPVSQTPERPYLRWWEDGIKKADGHINSTKYQTIRVGEKVTLVDNRSNDFIKCKVIFKHEYDTTEELLKAEGVKNIFPFLKDDDIDKGIQVFNEFPGWYLVEKYGCVAFGLEVVESKSSFYLRKEEQDNDDEF